MKLTWGLICASSLALSCCYLLSGPLARLAEPYRAESFAVEHVRAAGIDWPLDDWSDFGGGEYRYLFKGDDGTFADIRVRHKNDGSWAVVSFNKEFRPWQSETASR